MPKAQTTPEAPPGAPIFDLIDHFCDHIKLSAGALPSAANTAQSYANALKVFKRFIKNSYGRKRKVSAPYPINDLLASDILLAYYDWLNKTPPGRTKKVKAPKILHEMEGAAAEPDEAADGEADAENSDEIRPDKTIDKTINEENEDPVSGDIGFDPLAEVAEAPTPPARYAHSTIQFYLAAVKRFLTWVVAQGHVKNEYFDLAETKVKLEGGRGYSGKAYPHRKIDPNLAKILIYYDDLPMPKAPKPKAAKKSNLASWHVRRRQIALLRNRAIVYVLFETGLRVSELTSLKRDEVDRALKTWPLPEDVALPVTGKGGRQRTVWITQEALKRIKAYLATRTDPANVLFVGSKKGKPITRQMVWRIVKEGAEGAGVGDFTGPHAFRHWLARQLFNDEDEPVPMEDVQALLGHASPATTRTIYAPHSSNARLHRAIKKARKRPEETVDLGEDREEIGD